MVAFAVLREIMGDSRASSPPVPARHSMISFGCPSCQLKLSVKDEFAGRSSRCPTCKQALTVPSPDRTLAYALPEKIDGEESSLARIGHHGSVTLEGERAARTPTTTQKPPRSVTEALAGRK